MAITSNGMVTLSDLRNEYVAASGPVSMSQLNRGGGYVPLGGSRNTAIPTSGSNLSFSKYRNTSKTVSVTYEIIGGGGGGGFGVDDGGEGNRGTYAGSGTASTLSVNSTGSWVAQITASGGRGGENCGRSRGANGGTGAASAYGSGGSGGRLNSNGSSASSANYGAGGGGAGGDKGSTYDSGGCAGSGGSASEQQTGTLTLEYDTSIRLSVGSRGLGGNSTYDGGRGAGGYAKATWDGKVNSLTSSSADYLIN